MGNSGGRVMLSDMAPNQMSAGWEKKRDVAVVKNDNKMANHNVCAYHLRRIFLPHPQ